MTEDRATHLESHVRANLHFWLETIDLLERRLLQLGFESLQRRGRQSNDSEPDPMVEQFMTAHLLVLCLRHIDKRLRRLVGMEGALSSEALDAARAFFREYQAEDLKDLRDALEHSDDYASGTGKHQARIGLVRGGWLPGVKWTYSPDADSGGPRTWVSRIRLFGRDYEVGRILDLVRRVDATL